MPIFEYVCKDCKKRFEALVFGASQPKCPLCNGTNLDQQISVFAVGASGAAARPAPADCPNAAACGAGRG
jgi:putative FmdB family regulatory protein